MEIEWINLAVGVANGSVAAAIARDMMILGPINWAMCVFNVIVFLSSVLA